VAENSLNLAVLVSGSGTTLQNLIDQIAAGQLAARIALVIASRPGIGALDRAARANLPAVIAGPKEVFAHCSAAGANLVCLAGWLTLLEIPPAYSNRVMNIHPALLPAFGGRGMYGAHVHQAVLDHGCKISGCTVHFVDSQYDHGPIIVQQTCPVLETDTPATLAARVFEQEKTAYPRAISLFQQNRLTLHGRLVHIAAI
jgi:phosphoribosylglycinamide formyltransferase 1